MTISEQPINTRIYESIIVTSPELSDNDLDDFVEKLKAKVSESGGKNLAVEKWGRRRLAYFIQRYREGYYTRLVFSGSGETVKQLDHLYHVTEPVIRHVTVLCETPDGSPPKATENSERAQV